MRIAGLERRRHAVPLWVKTRRLLCYRNGGFRQLRTNSRLAYAGGPVDTVGRVVVERMRGLIGQPIIIENVAGADGSIGIGRAAGALPDGYTLVLGGLQTHVLNGAFYSLRYDVLNDFAPVALLVTPPLSLPKRLFRRMTCAN
jgi:hypothetical protein